MTQPSGWFDDPQDPSQLRYWDGVVWSSHVTPKVSPTVEQSNIGMPYAVTPAAARPHAPGSQGAQGTSPAPGGLGPPQQHQGQGQQDQDQWPAYGQARGPAGQFGQQPLGWASNWPTTPDGVVLSGWWKRVLAQIIDSIIVAIVALPLTFFPLRRAMPILGDFWREALAAAEAGTSTSPAQEAAAERLVTELMGPLAQVSLMMLALYLVYEIVFLTKVGATIGKMAVGISVRLRDTPGPPPLVAVLKRTAVKEGGSLVGLLPLVGLFGSMFRLLDVLWPLWDDKKQAIHDKVGATNVVVGPQPRRDA